MDHSFLGRGWKFPPTFETNNFSTVLVADDNDIRESLEIILGTKPGERVMLPDFGCDIHRMVFETMDETMLNVLQEAIRKAVLYFEPRITLNDTTVTLDKEEGNILYINLEYTVRLTNTRSNMVYPFYLLEGTNVRFEAAED